MKMATLFLILLFILQSSLCTTIQENESENITKKNGGFLFFMPKTLITGKNESVCLILFKSALPTKTIIDLKWKEQHYPTIRNLDSEHSCFELDIPRLKIIEPQYVSIKVQVQINGSIQSSHNQDPVLMYPYKFIKTFIDTDREIYKPGDKVKFRILVTDERLLPQNLEIPYIKIKSPLDITVAIWENTTLENGLLSLEYEMVPESITGKWKIEALSEIKTFEVFKYVLPRFKIDLFYPKLIYYQTDSLKIKVCSQYAYGRYVSGLAFVKVTDSHNNMVPVHKLKEMEDGCAEFVISSAELAFDKIKEKFSMYDPKMYIHITATITEKGTNRIDITSGKTLVYMKAFAMKFANIPLFQPGLPYKGKIRVGNIHSNLTNELIEVCYNMAIKKSWNYLNNAQCSNFTINENNIVEFNVLPMKNNVIHIQFNARSLNHTNVGDSFLAVRLFSPSSSYILLQQTVLEKNDDECRASQQFTVYYTTDRLSEKENITFYYMIKSHTRIYKLKKINHQVKKSIPDYLQDLKNIVGEKHKFVKLGTGVDSFVLQFSLDRRIVSRYQLLVYYITNNGETVAATKNVDIEPCLLKVDAKWQQDQMVPGATARLSIKTGAHSLCSISAVDKSTKFLSTTKQSLDINNIIKSLSHEIETPESGRKTCVLPIKKNSQASSLSYEPKSSSSNDEWDLKRRKRHVYSFSEDFDSYDIFNKFGTIVITNLKVVTKPCYSGPLMKDPNQVQFLTGQYEVENEEKTLAIRSHFPETWLWELIPVRNEIQLNRHLPHGITNWVTNVLCISDEEGIGFSQQMEISSFQSFFVEVLSPYSAKRDEHFYLYVHVSNYLNHKFPIRINVRLSEGLELKNSEDKLTASYCLLENNTITHMLQIKGTVTGFVNATVSAESDHQFPDHCGPETIVFKRDIVLKTIQIESEGYPMKVTKSALLCTSSSHTSNNVSWYISAPKEIVPGTDKAYIQLNGDLLGRTIENLEELLDIPTGCGEQIMASIAPNLYIMRYLQATHSLKNSVRQRIIKNLKIGYQRILNYVHKDGSFSAFGYHDPSGSMFLTAFVVRTLQEAKQYIYIDQKIIDKAVTWIFDHQLENGCFNTMQHVFQDMGGTSKENSTASLTAYVIISLMEANIEVPSSIKNNAKYCIRSQHNPDRYTLAISCYALFKVHWYSEATRMLKRLLAISNQQESMLWWSNKDNTSSATDIEITSYVLLILLHHNTTENLANAHSIVRWLLSKYGPNGGFKSTQDTVVALDAMAKYSKLIISRNLNLQINVEVHNQSQQINLKSEDRLKSKKIILENTKSNIKIIIDGEGCVLAQIFHTYYLRHVPKSEAFKLAVDVSPVSTIDQCSITSLSPCLAYTGPDGPANMAVMEVSLPSGYEADRASLYKLVESESSSRIKMFEELENKINLYFTKLDKQLICFSFNINENSLVEARKDSLVKLYDYYRPEYEILQFYRINNNCLHNNSVEIPEIAAKPLSTKIKINNISIELPEYNNEMTENLNKAIENFVKRSTDNVNMNFLGNNTGMHIFNGNKEHIKINKHLDPLNGFEEEVPLYSIKDETGNKKRHIEGNDTLSYLNSEFVNMHVDRDMPQGMEGNIPTYIKPTSAEIINITSNN